MNKSTNIEKNDENIKKESNKSQDIIVLNGQYINGKVIIENSETSQQLYNNNYFGTVLPDNRIELDILEALLLIERSRLKIFDIDNNQIKAEEITSNYISIDERIWVKYLVYRDIRQRGYIVRMGYGEGIDFRIYPRGSSRTDGIAKYFVFILDEENPVYLQNLDKITQNTLNARKQLILAIVDRLGEPTYYQLEQFSLNENKKKEKKW